MVARHSARTDRAAIRYHYDVGNAFYQLWLDQRMVYSCAYFRTGDETLDEAQRAKLDHICRKLRLAPGERLLDVGCGWGGLVIHAAQPDLRVPHPRLHERAFALAPLAAIAPDLVHPTLGQTIAAPLLSN